MLAAAALCLLLSQAPPPPAAADAVPPASSPTPTPLPPPAPKKPDVYVPAVTEKQREFAKQALAQMAENPRGAYSGISWYCNDGTEQPPKLNGCAEHGGGKM